MRAMAVELVGVVWTTHQEASSKASDNRAVTRHARAEYLGEVSRLSFGNSCLPSIAFDSFQSRLNGDDSSSSAIACLSLLE